MEHQQLQHTLEILQNDSWQEDKPWIDFVSRTVVDENLLVVERLEENIPWRDFAVFECHNPLTLPPNVFMVAIANDRKVYPLSGFLVGAFDSLIRQKVGQVKTPKEAEQLAQFYLSSIEYPGKMQYTQDVRDVNSQLTGTIRSKEGEYIVRILTKTGVGAGSGLPATMVMHVFRISPDASLVHTRCRLE
jgi:hypothetical protein